VGNGQKAVCGDREEDHELVLGLGFGFRKKLYDSTEALQADLDEWLHQYNHERAHQGKTCCGRTPFQTMIKGKQIWQEKCLNQT